jgi:hypothetical protein
MKITEKQLHMIKAIATSQYSVSNGRPKCAKDTATFIFDIVETPADKAVLTQLNRKGLVQVTKDAEENSVQLTESGYNVYAGRPHCVGYWYDLHRQCSVAQLLNIDLTPYANSVPMYVKTSEELIGVIENLRKKHGCDLPVSKII